MKFQSAADEPVRLAPELKVLERRLGRWRVMTPDRGYFGVRMDDLSEERKAQLPQPDKTGVLIVFVPSDGPAAQAGLKAEDILLRLQGKPIESVHSWRERMEQTKSGESVTIRFLRDHEVKEITVTLGEFPSLIRTTELGAGGHAVITRAERTISIYYFDPDAKHIRMFGLDDDGSVGETSFVSDPDETDDYAEPYEFRDLKGNKTKGVTHLRWLGPDKYTVWETDRFRNGERIPDSVPRNLERVK